MSTEPCALVWDHQGRDSTAFFPDVFMVTNEAASDDIKERYGVCSSALTCVGSTYLVSSVTRTMPCHDENSSLCSISLSMHDDDTAQESLVLDASSPAFSKGDVHEILGVSKADEGSQAQLVPFFVSPDGKRQPSKLMKVPRVA